MKFEGTNKTTIKARLYGEGHNRRLSLHIAERNFSCTEVEQGSRFHVCCENEKATLVNLCMALFEVNVITRQRLYSGSLQ